MNDAETATELWIVGVEVHVYEFTSAVWVVVCYCGPLHTVLDDAHHITCEYCITEGMVSTGGVAAVSRATPTLVCFPGVCWAASTLAVMQGSTATSITNFHAVRFNPWRMVRMHSPVTP
jgi:hypothetical protein